jgi:hypothetical protein
VEKKTQTENFYCFFLSRIGSGRPNKDHIWRSWKHENKCQCSRWFNQYPTVVCWTLLNLKDGLKPIIGMYLIPSIIME